MCVLSFNCKIRPFHVSLRIKDPYPFAHTEFYHSADANLPYLVNGHAVIVNIPHVQMSIHVNSQPN